jgi:predicted CXXCH cytochrome family protein
LNKSSKPVAVAGIFFAVLALAGYLYPSATEAVPQRVLLENERGRVVFTHKAHTGYMEADCSSCHHEIRITRGTTGLGRDADALAAGQPSVLACGACHGTESDPDFIKNHQEYYSREGGPDSCTSCHHTAAAGLSDGWDHAAHIEYAGEDCQTCHHTEDIEPEPMACANCHDAAGSATNGVSLKTAAHSKCLPCHEDLFDQKLSGCASCHRFAPPVAPDGTSPDAAQLAACASCHEDMPSRMNAFHTQCFTCHDDTGKGPGSQAPCAQCHAR